MLSKFSFHLASFEEKTKKGAPAPEKKSVPFRKRRREEKMKYKINIAGAVSYKDNCDGQEWAVAAVFVPRHPAILAGGIKFIWAAQQRLMMGEYPNYEAHIARYGGAWYETAPRGPISLGITIPGKRPETSFYRDVLGME